jgi:tRNA modification GTPase
VIAGYKVLVADTAGLRDPAELIEAEGVRRARAWAEAADLRLWVVDASAADGSWTQAVDLVRAGDLALLNKSDMPAGADAEFARTAAAAGGADQLLIAATAGRGLGSLRERLKTRVVEALSGAEFPAATRARHRAALEDALVHVRRGLAVPEPELAAEDVRLAGRALGRITGRIDPESVLDRIFASFCIGK